MRKTPHSSSMARQLGMAGKKSPDLGFRVVEYGESLVNGWYRCSITSGLEMFGT